MLFDSMRRSTRFCCIVALIGLIASVWVSRSLYVAADRGIHAQLERHAVEHSVEIEHSLLNSVSAVESMGQVVAALDAVSEDEFERYAAHVLDQYPSLRALGWNPVVLEDERPAFEAELRARGKQQTRITERSLGGELVSASPRSEYVVVKYISPYEGNEDALGYDVGSEARRRAALESAAQNGEIGMTAQISLVQEEGAPGFLAFWPVYDRNEGPDAVPTRANLAGFGVGVFQAADVVATATTAIARQGFAVTIRDVTDPSTEGLLYTSTADGDEAIDASEPPFFAHTGTIEQGGRKWQVEISAGRNTAADLRSPAYLIALGAGLIITAVFVAFLFSVLESNSSLAREIRRREKAEAEHRRLEAKLREAQKLESLGLFAGGIAHEFNNLLTGILGCTELAMESVAAVEPVREDLEALRSAALRAAELTGQMSSYTGNKHFIAQPFDVSREIGRMRAGQNVKTRDRVNLVYELSLEPLKIEGDPAQIRQLVSNLVTNAIEASSDTGDVIVRTGKCVLNSETIERAHFGESLSPVPHVFVEVSDQGCGMSPEDQARVFDPFFSTKFSGKGLGLSVVMGIVRSHGGAIWVESAEGVGTTFTAVFPILEQPAHEAIDISSTVHSGVMH